MSSLQEQLRQHVLTPACGEVWMVDGQAIQFSDPKDMHKNRAVVIAHCDEDYIRENGIPIIPLSRSGEAGIKYVPISKAYQELNADSKFKPHGESKAIVTHHQKVKPEFLIERCGKLEYATMCAILYSLCGKYPGHLELF